tara:strand:- start:393 stop:905 length:513 start_codon:yes stop_codon:yes gene_type:complete
MNILFFTLIIFVIIYLILSWFVKTSSKRITSFIRIFLIILSVIFAGILVYAGRFILTLPIALLILPLIKTKAGLTLVQLMRIWGLLRVLKNSGRFNFGQNRNAFSSSSNMSLNEAYQILNLDIKKKYTKKEVSDAHKKIISKVHPDISPETAKLASIVNEARDLVDKNIT